MTDTPVEGCLRLLSHSGIHRSLMGNVNQVRTGKEKKKKQYSLLQLDRQIQLASSSMPFCKQHGCMDYHPHPCPLSLSSGPGFSGMSSPCFGCAELNLAFHGCWHHSQQGVPSFRSSLSPMLSPLKPTKCQSGTGDELCPGGHLSLCLFNTYIPSFPLSLCECMVSPETHKVEETCTCTRVITFKNLLLLCCALPKVCSWVVMCIYSSMSDNRKPILLMYKL